VADYIAQPVAWGAFRDVLVVAVAVALALLSEIVRPRRMAPVAGYIILAGFLSGLALAWTGPQVDASLWSGIYVVDPMSRFFSMLFLLAGALAVLLSLSYMRKNPSEGAYYVCLGSSATGMMLMAGSGEIITMYVALELASVSLYLLAAMQAGKGTESREAGLKYLLVGAFSSALFLYGVSFVYQATGTTVLAEIRQVMATHSRDGLMLIGLVFIIAALGFKVAAVPFHMWAPDVYEGGPPPMVAFASTASKAAGFVVMARLLLAALPGMRADWTFLLSLMAALTMVLGALAAIPQSNLRRMLAYSSIGQAGFLLVGFVPGSELGMGSVMFYLAVYLFTNIGAFAVVTIIEGASGSSDIPGYAGLARRSPALALAMLLALLSLAGIPPLGGFAGKLFLFSSAMQEPGRFLWLVVLGVLLSTVSLYYYLLVIRQMYIEPPKSEAKIRVGLAAGLALAACVAGILVTGIAPGFLVDAALDAGRAFLSLK
jgi:NADH-quinone oxidoreductase subunit N